LVPKVPKGAADVSVRVVAFGLNYVAMKLRRLVRRIRGPYVVEVDDNFHYMDESERYTLGRFATAGAAIRAAKALVDDYLKSNYQKGMTADELFSHYTSHGEDPHIHVDGEGDSETEDGDVDFSAWDYARERCQTLCKRAE
jgi:hypothetical protein